MLSICDIDFISNNNQYMKCLFGVSTVLGSNSLIYWVLPAMVWSIIFVAVLEWGEQAQGVWIICPRSHS